MSVQERLRGLVSRFLGVKSGGSGYVVIDFRTRKIVLPNGDAIDKDDIISFDPSTGVLVYRAPDGSISTTRIPIPGSPRADPAARLLEALAARAHKKEDREHQPSMYT